MLLHFLFLNRMRRPECRALFDDYATRLHRFAEVRVTELREANDASLARIKTDPSARWILLDAPGRQYTSLEFSRWLAKHRDRATRELVFVCGADAGYPESFRQRAHESLSLSPLTMPHELARVVLAEQLYRAFAILTNHPYAK